MIALAEETSKLRLRDSAILGYPQVERLSRADMARFPRHPSRSACLTRFLPRDRTLLLHWSSLELCFIHSFPVTDTSTVSTARATSTGCLDVSIVISNNYCTCSKTLGVLMVSTACGWRHQRYCTTSEPLILYLDLSNSSGYIVYLR